jgi:SP family xylose:H+ symportor-like MFS transporter
MNEILFNIVITGAINLIFTVFAMLLVDRFGRRRLMLFGCVSIGICHLGASYAYHVHLHGVLILGLTLAAIACYAMTLAPITWVLIVEIFPNAYRGTAVSISVAALWTCLIRTHLHIPDVTEPIWVFRQLSSLRCHLFCRRHLCLFRRP